MSIWDRYESRISANTPRRKDMVDRTQRYILNKIYSSASSFTVSIDGIRQDVAIINTDNLNEKFIYSLPGEDIEHGGLVEWMDNLWLITEKDAATEMYTRAKMIQCNYLLRWIDKDAVIHEQWCIIEDGTKLKHAPVCNSLVCWKRHAKRTSLIAGTPLEPYHQNGIANSYKRQWFKNDKDWAISSQASNRGRFNDYPDSRSRSKRSETGSPKPHMWHGEDIVCSHMKV